MNPVWMLLAICGSCAVFFYIRRRYIMQFGTYFNLIASIYMGLGLILYSLETGQQFTNEIDQIGWMSVAAVSGFNLAYWLAGLRQSTGPGQGAGYLPSHTTMLFIVGVGLSFKMAGILLIGFFDFFSADRVTRFALFQSRQLLLYVGHVINICLPIVLARYLCFGLRRDRTLLLFIVVEILIYGTFTISRYDLSILILSLCYFFERYRHTRKDLIIGSLIGSLLLTVFFKPSMYRFLLGDIYPHEIDFNEYTNWIRHTILLMSRPEVELPHNGYWLALKSLFVISPKEDALSEWFIKNFYMERTLLFPSLSYGFSGVWEGYTANGFAGVALHFAFIGACFGLLEKSPTAMRQIFIVFALILSYRLFRSEIYNFVRTYAWYFAYPTFAIVFLDKFMIWATRRSTMNLSSGHTEHPTRFSVHCPP